MNKNIYDCLIITPTFSNAFKYLLNDNGIHIIFEDHIISYNRTHSVTLPYAIIEYFNEIQQPNVYTY